jgi:hypothetical protein
MRRVRSITALGALALLVTLAGLVVSALPGNLRTEGLVARAQNCVLPGKATVVGGVQTCDCTTFSGNDCGCVAPPKNCPPAAEAMLEN